MSGMKSIQEIITEKLGLEFSAPDPLREQKVSQRLWYRINEDREFDTDEETAEKLKAYWKRVHEPQTNIFDLQKQRIIFDDLYRSILKVGEDIDEVTYFEKTKKDTELKVFINDLLGWYFKTSDFKKGGFYVYSPPGVGKTSIMKTLLHMSMIYGKKENMGSVEYNDMNRMISLHKSGVRQDFTFFSDQHVVIDDLSERMNNVTHFSDKFDISEIIESRYTSWKNTGKHTIITSNLFPEKSESLMSIKSLMTERAIDRFNEQYQIVYLTGESKRINK